MKKITLFSFFALLLFACGEVDDKYYGKEVDTGSANTPPDDSGIDWAAAADYSTQKLIADFWKSPGNDFVSPNPDYHFTNGVKGITDESNNYWPQAHATDVIIDAYLRARADGDTARAAAYKDILDKGYKIPIGDGATKNKIGVLWTSYASNPRDTDISACFGNQFVDDMEWHALTLMRLYEATGEAVYLKEAQKLYAQIWKTWDLEVIRNVGGAGGFLWSYGKESTDEGLSKNACSNGPGCLAAIRLHELSVTQANYATDSHPDYRDFDYLANAERVYNWVSSVLFNKETGLVYSKISQKKGLQVTSGLTYDQGTFLGASHLLYKYTGRRTYLDNAAKVALYTITGTGIVQGGLLRDEGVDGNNSLFKGIFIRYAVRLANESELDKASRIRLHDFIKRNAITLWTDGMLKDAQGNAVGLFTPDWSMNQETVLGKGPDYARPQLGWQVSGATLMEAMNLLEDPR